MRRELSPSLVVAAALLGCGLTLLLRLEPEPSRRARLPSTATARIAATAPIPRATDGWPADAPPRSAAPCAVDESAPPRGSRVHGWVRESTGAPIRDATVAIWTSLREPPRKTSTDAAGFWSHELTDGRGTCIEVWAPGYEACAEIAFEPVPDGDVEVGPAVLRAGGGPLTGSVRDDLGRPLELLVELDGRRWTTSDPTGTFRFEGVPEGPHHVSFGASLGGPRTLRDAVVVAPRGSHLDVVLPRTGRLALHLAVAGEAGTWSLADAPIVFAGGTVEDRRNQGTVTDPVFQLPPGPVKVLVGRRTGHAAYAALELVAGRETSLDLELHATSARIAGRIVDARGLGISRASVLAYAFGQASNPYALVAEARTGPAGEYELRVPPGGEYAIAVAGSTYSAPLHATEAVHIAMDGRLLDLVVARGGSISGSIAGIASERGGSRARVSVWSAAGVIETLADEAGRFAIEHVPPGRAVLVASSASSAAGDDGDAETPTFAVLPLELEPADSLAEARLVMRPGVELRGRVAGPDGAPLARCRVELRPSDPSIRRPDDDDARTWTDEQGRLEFPACPPLRYTLRLDGPSTEFVVAKYGARAAVPEIVVDRSGFYELAVGR